MLVSATAKVKRVLKGYNRPSSILRISSQPQGHDSCQQKKTNHQNLHACPFACFSPESRLSLLVGGMGTLSPGRPPISPLRGSPPRPPRRPPRRLSTGSLTLPRRSLMGSLPTGSLRLLRRGESWARGVLLIGIAAERAGPAKVRSVTAAAKK